MSKSPDCTSYVVYIVNYFIPSKANQQEKAEKKRRKKELRLLQQQQQEEEELLRHQQQQTKEYRQHIQQQEQQQDQQLEPKPRSKLKLRSQTKEISMDKPMGEMPSKVTGSSSSAVTQKDRVEPEVTKLPSSSQRPVPEFDRQNNQDLNKVTHL